MLIVEWHHPVVEDLGRGDWGLTVIELGKGDFGISVDYGLLKHNLGRLTGATDEFLLAATVTKLRETDLSISGFRLNSAALLGRRSLPKRFSLSHIPSFSTVSNGFTTVTTGRPAGHPEPAGGSVRRHPRRRSRIGAGLYTPRDRG